MQRDKSTATSLRRGIGEESRSKKYLDLRLREIL